MKKITGILLGLGIAFSFQTARGESLPELTQFIQTEIVHLSKPISKDNLGSSEALQDDYFFRRLLLRVQAAVGIDVPWLVSFQIVPEVELVWQRPYPEGMSDYKPPVK